MMEAHTKHVTSTVTPLIPAAASLYNRKPWNPNVGRRIPWKGLGALLGGIAGIGAAVAILIMSDGQPTSKWSVQPAVYLAIASAVTNICIHFALGRAVTVAWWKRATQPNTKLADLHRLWSYGDSLWESIVAGRNVNLIAFASIFVAILPINGPFLQRASRVRVGRSVSFGATDPVRGHVKSWIDCPNK